MLKITTPMRTIDTCELGMFRSLITRDNRTILALPRPPAIGSRNPDHPKDVERAILIPIEQALEGVQGIQHLHADGHRGFARFYVQAKEGADVRAGACPGNKVDFRFPKSADTATWYYLDNFTLKPVGGEKP